MYAARAVRQFTVVLALAGASLVAQAEQSGAPVQVGTSGAAVPRLVTFVRPEYRRSRYPPASLATCSWRRRLAWMAWRGICAFGGRFRDSIRLLSMPFDAGASSRRWSEACLLRSARRSMSRSETISPGQRRPCRRCGVHHWAPTTPLCSRRTVSMVGNWSSTRRRKHLSGRLSSLCVRADRLV